MFKFRTGISSSHRRSVTLVHLGIGVFSKFEPQLNEGDDVRRYVLHSVGYQINHGMEFITVLMTSRVQLPVRLDRILTCFHRRANPLSFLYQTTSTTRVQGRIPIFLQSVPFHLMQVRYKSPRQCIPLENTSCISPLIPTSSVRNYSMYVDDFGP